MYRVAICNDCPADRNQLIEHIKKTKIGNMDIEIYEYESGIKLLEAMNFIIFAVIFLDVKRNGLEIARRIWEIDIHLVLVFYTSDIELSIPTIEVQPFRYIVKNMNCLQMDVYIDAILEKMQDNKNTPLLRAHIGKRQLFIKAEHIIYIEKYKKNARVHVTMQVFKLYNISLEDGIPDIRLTDKLENIYENLKHYGFGWPHDSYIINFRYLCSCSAKSFKLSEVEGEFQITRSKAKIFQELKNRFMEMIVVSL